MEISTGNIAKTEPHGENFNQSTELPDTIPAIQIGPSPDVTQSVNGQTLDSLVTPSGTSAVGTVGLAAVEGLTLAGGLQLQQIQLGSQVCVSFLFWKVKLSLREEKNIVILVQLHKFSER